MNKQRIKQNDEVFTPLLLVDEILNKLPSEVWQQKKTFLDPSCGDGNFLVRVVVWKIHNGSTSQQALETTYGVDIMPDNIEHARQRVLIHAFAASKVDSELLPHLSSDEEQAFIQISDFKVFANEFKAIVYKNIVYHDALTYDYSFSGQPMKTKEQQEQDWLHNCGVDLSLPIVK